jgi:hypothetical protein
MQTWVNQTQLCETMRMDKEEFFAIVVSLAIIGTGCLMVYWFLQPHF